VNVGPLNKNSQSDKQLKTVKYLGVTFENGLKLKVSLAAKRMKFFRVFNYIYACVGSTTSPMLCVIYFILIVSDFIIFIILLWS